MVGTQTDGVARPPEHVRPMLAVAGTLPTNEAAWAFELKWDGIRAVAHWNGSALRFETRNLRDDLNAAQ